MGIDFNHHQSIYNVWKCLHVYKKAHAQECYTVLPEWHWEEVTVVLQPTAKITLASFDTGDSSTLTNTHLASRISISVASLASQFKLYALYPSLVNAMLHSRLCLQRAAEMQKISLLFGTSTVLCLNEWLTSLLLTT